MEGVVVLGAEIQFLFFVRHNQTANRLTKPDNQLTKRQTDSCPMARSTKWGYSLFVRYRRTKNVWMYLHAPNNKIGLTISRTKNYQAEKNK